MKKRIFILSILLLSLSILGACSKKKDNTEAESTQVTEVEQEEKKIAGELSDIIVDQQEDENNNSYMVIKAVDADGIEIWSYNTELSHIFGVMKGDFYCYEDGNKTIALNLSDGTPAWTFEQMEMLQEEYAIITVLDENGNECWSYKTQTIYENSVLYGIDAIGLVGDYFYYKENDAIVALNSTDGTLAWKNTDFGNNYVGNIAIGTDGTLYLSAPDVAFFALDKQGETLKKIDSFDDGYHTTSEIVYCHDYVEVTRSNSSLVPEGRITYRVNLSDYSYEVSKPDERVSNEKFTTYGAGPAVDVQYEHLYTTEDNGESGEYAAITGVDASGNTVWEYTTEKYSAAQYGYTYDIGVHGNYYYYEDYRKIIARNVSDGSKVWEAGSCGYIADSVFDENGTLYLSLGGESTCSFLAIDKNGNTVADIELPHAGCCEAWNMEYMGDYIELTIGVYEPESVLHIQLDDFSYEQVR